MPIHRTRWLRVPGHEKKRLAARTPSPTPPRRLNSSHALVLDTRGRPICYSIVEAQAARGGPQAWRNNPWSCPGTRASLLTRGGQTWGAGISRTDPGCLMRLAAPDPRPEAGRFVILVEAQAVRGGPRAWRNNPWSCPGTRASLLTRGGQTWGAGISRTDPGCLVRFGGSWSSTRGRPICYSSRAPHPCDASTPLSAPRR